MAYIFDSNIFIRSKNEMPMEIWPTFWTRMRELIEAGHIRSSIEVKKEINRGDDELTRFGYHRLRQGDRKRFCENDPGFGRIL